MDERHDKAQHALIDPLVFEEAGRACRRWLDRLAGRAERQADTSIAWEDGETDRRQLAPPES